MAQPQDPAERSAADQRPVAAVAVLAGGQSRRMGVDKASLRRGGVTLLERTARAALAAAPVLPILIVGRPRPEAWPADLPAAFVPDDAPGQGPLPALGTALRAAGGPVLALACDMPLLSTAALRWLVRQSEQADADEAAHGLVATNQGQPEPLFAIYRPACLPLLARRMEAGQRSLRGLIAAGRFTLVPAPDEVAACLRNVNTPAELAALGDGG